MNEVCLGSLFSSEVHRQYALEIGSENSEAQNAGFTALNQRETVRPFPNSSTHRTHARYPHRSTPHLAPIELRPEIDQDHPFHTRISAQQDSLHAPFGGTDNQSLGCYTFLSYWLRTARRADSGSVQEGHNRVLFETERWCHLARLLPMVSQR